MSHPGTNRESCIWNQADKSPLCPSNEHLFAQITERATFSLLVADTRDLPYAAEGSKISRTGTNMGGHDKKILLEKYLNSAVSDYCMMLVDVSSFDFHTL